MILNIGLIYISPGYYTTVPKLCIENLWVHLKKKEGKRLPTNKNQLISFITKEWEKIPSEYDIPKLIQSMRRRLQAVIDAQGGHTKY